MYFRRHDDGSAEVCNKVAIGSNDGIDCVCVVVVDAPRSSADRNSLYCFLLDLEVTHNLKLPPSGVSRAEPGTDRARCGPYSLVIGSSKRTMYAKTTWHIAMPTTVPCRGLSSFEKPVGIMTRESIGIGLWSVGSSIFHPFVVSVIVVPTEAITAIYVLAGPIFGLRYG